MDGIVGDGDLGLTMSDGFKAAYDAVSDGAIADAAEEGFKATTTMLAVHGRAATRGEASRSLEDPGAKVASLIMQAFAKSL